MDLAEKINIDLKDALKAGDKLRLKTVRSIRALILEFEKSGTDKKFNTEEEIKLLSSAAKKRRESIEEYRKAGREDLASIEEAELNVIIDYLPKQLNEEEIECEVKAIAGEISAAGKADFPKLMQASIKKLKGQAEGKAIKAAVEKVLG
ncbi:MAG: GatB/YqeY domain-containing protein [Ignavibacteriae bacterium]|nr:MAG: GatB/YqeY domain-containing protein [Ignavibacteriota bacterium]